MARILVQDAAFDLAAETAALTAGRADVGGVASFLGVCRGDDGLVAMVLEHYPGMTERAIAAFVEQAMARFSLIDALVIHRYGRLEAGEPIMMVATAAPHRIDAFAAAEFLMDWLKSRAPFWKKEISADGSEWVAAKDSDEDALSRW